MNIPIPHYYTGIQGWFSHAGLYQSIVEQANKPNRVYTFVEVGAWKGRSSAYMAVEIINSRKPIKFYAVDTWDGSIEHKDPTNPAYEPLLSENDGLYKEFLKNIWPAHDVVFPIRLPSVEAAKLFPDNSVDFVMIDAGHTYEDAKSDIEAWYPKLSPGAILAGDDYDWPGVKKAVEEKFGSEYYESGDKLWMVQKPDLL